MLPVRYSVVKDRIYLLKAYLLQLSANAAPVPTDERHRLKVAAVFAFSSHPALRNSTGTKLPSPRSKSLQEADWTPAQHKGVRRKRKLIVGNQVENC